MDRVRDRRVGAALGGWICTFKPAKFRQIDVIAPANEFGHAEPPGVDLPGYHAGRDEDGERRGELFHDRKRMGQIVCVAVVERQGDERARRRRLKPRHRFIERNQIQLQLPQPAEDPLELAGRTAQHEVIGIERIACNHAVQREDDAAPAIAQRQRPA